MFISLGNGVGKCCLRSGLVAFLLTLTALTGCQAKDKPPGAESQSPAPPGAVMGGSTITDWPMNMRTLAGQRYAPFDDINPNTIDQLGLAWEFDDFTVRGRTHRGVEANPIVIDGTMYFVGPWNVVYAVDALSGKQRWRYVPDVDGSAARNACCDVVSRGIAVHNGKIYTATLDGFLIAIDMATGKELWKVDTFYTRKWSYTITGAPYVAGDNILVGNSGAEMGVRGYVSAYNAEDGSLSWRFWAVPGDPATEPDETPEVTMARKTWPQDARWEMGLGGTAWDGMAYDSETNTAFLGLGNGGPHPQWRRSKSGSKEGDNLFLSSIVAVDADTGRLKWYYQTTPHDSWDYTATSPMVFAELDIDGKSRKVIMQAPKNGIFYTLDRITGELLRAEPYTVVNWTTGIDMKTGRPNFSEQGDYSESPKIVWPSVAGGHSWHPMSFSPRTGLVYLPVTEAPMRLETIAPQPRLPGTHFHLKVQFPPFNNPGDEGLLKGKPAVKVESRLKAWDPVQQKVVWQSAAMPFISGGSLVSGDLVFQGASDGYFRAFNAKTGEVLKELFVGTSIMAAPISYKVDGIQYIAVMAGGGGPRGARFGEDEAGYAYENYERLLVFKLGGESVPLPPKRSQPALPPVPEAIAASAETLAHGEALYKEHCQRCHILGGAIGNYPNLWHMRPETTGAFEAIVGQGVFKYAGMDNFSNVLSADDIHAIKAFIINDTIAKREGDQGATSNTAYH